MKKALKWIVGTSVGLLVLFLLVGLIAVWLDPEGVEKRNRESAAKDSLLGISEVKKDSIEKAQTAKRDSIDQANERAEKQAEKEKDDCLTAYVMAERGLKNSLKDPDSYEGIAHESYVVKQKPGEKAYIQVLLHYRAKNSFGGYVVNKRYFDFDKKLNLVNTFEG